MLDHLVESRNQNAERRKLSGFMFSTGVILATAMTAGLIYSIFSQNIVLGANGLELSTIVAPIPNETKPETVSEPKPQTVQTAQNNQSKIPTQTENILRSDENPSKIPDSVSVTPSTAKARPNSTFLIDKVDSDVSNNSSVSTERRTGKNTNQIVGIANKSKVIEKAERDENSEVPPPIKKKEVKPAEPVSLGVVNGKAKNLVMPIYTAAAKGLNIKGAVKVQVLIDEDGNVISASAISGHPLLKSSAITAARASKFTPTTLSNQKVKVTGFILYNFT